MSPICMRALSYQSGTNGNPVVGLVALRMMCRGGDLLIGSKNVE